MFLRHKNLLLLVLAWISLCLTIGTQAAGQAPRVAVWDPQVGSASQRVTLDLEQLNRTSQCLRDGGVEVSRIIADQITDRVAFSAKRFDAFVFPGSEFPRSAVEPFQHFADEGGVLVALDAKAPFNIAMAMDTRRKLWELDPPSPTFAWQINDLRNLFAIKYIFSPAHHDLGVKHTATALLKKYLPDAPDIDSQLPSLLVVPTIINKAQGEFYPLLRSVRADGLDTTPQLYIARLGRRHAIISTIGIYTSEQDTARWPLGKKTLLALAHIARDLHEGTLVLKPEQKINLDQNLPKPEPLRSRVPFSSVRPAGVKPLLTFGKFDGSSLELGEILSTGELRDLREGDTFPRALLPGAGVRLKLPSLSANQAYQLRVRGAYAASNAGLRAQLGDQVVWNELLQYIDPAGTGNFGAPALDGIPAQFTRIIFLPPALQPSTGPQLLSISNHGRQPIFFDAIQVEQRTEPGREMIIGMNNATFHWSPDSKVTAPSEITTKWSRLRGGINLAAVGAPGDPNRWKVADTTTPKLRQMNGRLELILGYTPKWAAISPERYRLAEIAGRPHTCPPDLQKWLPLVREAIQRYGDGVEEFEIWNEAETQQFFRGSWDELFALIRATAKVIREEKPNARIIFPGMAGFNAEFVRRAAAEKVIDAVDLFGFHLYAGKSPAWDVTYGLVEGELLSCGIDKEIYCNESGFVWKPNAWFVPPPLYTPETQADLTNIAIARVLANGLAKLTMFNASGSDTDAFDHFDATGKPRPAYMVIDDYVKLIRNGGGRRLEISITGAGGAPLAGVYAVASEHPDGSVTLIVNPAESPSYQQDAIVRVPLTRSASVAQIAAATNPTQPKVLVHRAGDVLWAEVSLTVVGRTIVTLKP